VSIKNIVIKHPSEKLTPREVDVLTLAAQGEDRPQMAASLKISKDTVKAYLVQACRKLNAKNKAQAAAIAVELDLIAPYRLVPLHDKEILKPTHMGNAPEKNKQVLTRLDTLDRMANRWKGGFTVILGVGALIGYVIDHVIKWFSGR